MEFADLLYEYLKENGVKSHIQPGFSIPRISKTPADFDNMWRQDSIQVRANQLGMERTDIIRIILQPQSETIWVSYWRPPNTDEKKIIKAQKRRLRRFGRESYTRVMSLSPCWECLGKIHESEILDRILDKIIWIRRAQGKANVYE